MRRFPFYNVDLSGPPSFLEFSIQVFESFDRGVPGFVDNWQDVFSTNLTSPRMFPVFSQKTFFIASL